MSASGDTGGQRSLPVAVRGVLRRAVEAYSDDPDTAQWLARQAERLDEPLRVALAGKVKAGKSTLLNALVGDRIAATDAGECTRVITWYRNGHSPKVVLHPHGGRPQSLPVHRQGGELSIDLNGASADEVDRIVVDWPSQHLRTQTLIDTPGIGSLTRTTSERTREFLTPEDDAPAEADAVVYLMRHLHATDAEFLESFRDQGVARASSVNTVAVVSRADEIGGGRVDAMLSARMVAQRYQTEPTLRGLAQKVVPVAGLLAETGRTLRQGEFDALAALAAAPRDEAEALLLSADRFLSAASEAVPDMGGPEGRRALLDRFGLFGIRLSMSLIRQATGTATELSAELVRRSGLDALRAALDTQFSERRDLLKARSALMALESVLRADRRGEAGPLATEVERILAGAHEFTELRLLSALRTGEVTLPVNDTADADEADRLLGGSGLAAPTRLGLPADAGRDDQRAAARATRSRWARRAENPLASRAAADACRSVVRSCEGMLAALRD